MVNTEFQLELVKVNFIIVGAVVSAISLGVSYSLSHMAIGVAVLGTTAYIQYLNMLPEFSQFFFSKNTYDSIDVQKKLADWYMIFAGAGYILIAFGFAAPYLVPGSNIAAVAPAVFLVFLFGQRLLLLLMYPEKEVVRLDYAIVGLFAILIALLAAGVILFIP